MPDIPQPTGEIVLYRTEDGETRTECRFADENIWLTQALMSELFQTSVPNVNLHIKNILAEGELAEESTIKDYLIVRREGARQVERPVKHYDRVGPGIVNPSTAGPLPSLHAPRDHGSRRLVEGRKLRDLRISFGELSAGVAEEERPI